MTRSYPILVLGLGNELLQDDGLGIHALRMLRLQPPPAEAILAEIGTAALNALPFLEDARHVIALDAIAAGDPPGTLHHYTLQELVPTSISGGLHDLGLHGVLQMLPPGNPIPTIEVWGLEPASTELGLEPTHEVARALPHLVKCVCGRIAGLSHPASRPHT